MSFAEWQSLSPAVAAGRVHARIAALPPAQQRATVAWAATAEGLEAELAAAPPQAPLRGLPWFAKDLFDVAGIPTRAGSTFLPEVRPRPRHDSHLVDRVRRAGAALAGKSHLHEFAYGLTGENPHYGDCEHPRFPGRTTGGSSSGSAALVAAGVVPFAAGTDTGCSVRLPAAFCGLYGFRLTPGDTWIRDAFPLAPTFDTAGWFTAGAGDMRLLLEALLELPTAGDAPRGGWLEWPDLDASLASVYRAAAERFGPRVTADLQTSLHRTFAPSASAYGTITGAEAWSTHRAWFADHADAYDPAVRARLASAARITPEELAAARTTLAAVRAAWAMVFAELDFVILPAAPMAALTKADCTAVNRQRILACNAPASLGGRPVLTIPVALPDGLSLGLQVVVAEPRSPAVAWLLRQAAA